MYSLCTHSQLGVPVPIFSVAKILSGKNISDKYGSLFPAVKEKLKTKLDEKSIPMR